MNPFQLILVAASFVSLGVESVPNPPGRHDIQATNTARHRDKTGTTTLPALPLFPQVLQDKMFTASTFSGAEGTGLEPATPEGAPEFQSGC